MYCPLIEAGFHAEGLGAAGVGGAEQGLREADDATDEGARMPPCASYEHDNSAEDYEQTHHLEQFRHRFAGRSTDVEPVLYSLHAPLDCLCVLLWIRAGVVGTEKLDGLRVPPLTLIHGDNVKYAAVSEAVNGHAYADSHEAREKRKEKEMTCRESRELGHANATSRPKSSHGVI